MNKKYKATPFTRFLVFMIFFTPLAYIGASYLNGENGIEKAKKVLKINESTDEKIIQKEQKVLDLQKEILQLKSEIEALKKAN